MKRSLIILALVLVAAIGGTVLWTTAPWALIESEELALPEISPLVITPDIPTFVTFTVSLPDPNILRPKIQFFDPFEGHWRGAREMLDNGTFEDELKGDRRFTRRLWFLDDGTTTQVGFKRRDGTIKIKGEVSSPIQLRLAAKMKGQRGLVVSLIFDLTTEVPSRTTIGEPGPTEVSVPVPANLIVIPTTNPNYLKLEKPGNDGYVVNVLLRPNPSAWTLELWVLACVFGPCTGLPGPQDPQTLADRLGIGSSEPIQIAGLAGFRIELHSETGTTIVVVLDDPANGRTITFEIYPLGGEQIPRFEDNLPEALSIINGLQL